MMIIAIRISGQVGIPKDQKETLHRLRLRKKYSAVLLKNTEKNLKTLRKLRNRISYGEIGKEVLAELIKKRGKPLKRNNKIDVEKILEQIEKKNLKALGLKPFFRLHPPRKGIDTKIHAGKRKGVLGENKKIDDLVKRML